MSSHSHSVICSVSPHSVVDEFNVISLKKISVTDVFYVFPNFQRLLSTFSRGAIIIAGPKNLCAVELIFHSMTEKHEGVIFVVNSVHSGMS